MKKQQTQTESSHTLNRCVAACIALLMAISLHAQSFSLPCKKYPATVPFKTEAGVDRYWHVTSVKCLGAANGGYKFRISGIAKKTSHKQNVDIFYIMPGNKLRVAGAYFFPAITEGSNFSFTIVSAFRGYAPSKFNGFFILNKFLAAELKQEQEAAAEEATVEEEDQTIQTEQSVQEDEDDETSSITPVTASTTENEAATQTIVASPKSYSISKTRPSCSYAWPGLSITSLSITEKATTLNMQFNNRLYHEGWMNINSNAYLTIPGTSIKAKLKGAWGVSTSPGKTNITYNEVRTFTLIFEPLPENTTTFNFYETPTSRWKIEGVRVR